jgi:uncharacterized repeat protein (TIGR02543 family)
MKTGAFKLRTNIFGCVMTMFFMTLALAYTGCSKDDPVKSYTVTFNADGGTPVPPAQKVGEGGTVIAPAVNPTKEGYVFVFWHLSGAATAYDFQLPVKNDFTLYAKWSDPPVAYWQVSWELNGGSWPANDNHVTQAAKGGTLAEPVAPEKTDSIFDGWYRDAALTDKVTFPCDVTSVTADFTLYAKWSVPPVAYWQVSWELDGGSWPANDNHVIQAAKGGTLAEPVAPEKTGSIFDGWYRDAALIDKVTFPCDVTGITADFTLYAKWSDPPVAYWQITWELNGGSWPANDNHATQAVKGGTLAEPAAPVKIGRIFDGWYRDAALTDKVMFPCDVTGVTADFTLYAKWSDPPGEYVPFTHEGHSYRIVKQTKTWAEAAADAVSLGGYLAEIGSKAEQEAIQRAIQQSGISPNYTSVADGGGIGYIWTGATDVTSEGTWLWNGTGKSGTFPAFWTGSNTGSAVSGSYVNWGGTADGKLNEPDNFTNSGVSPKGQNAAAIGLTSWPSGSSSPLGRAGEWNDIAETNRIYYLVEFDSAE